MFRRKKFAALLTAETVHQDENSLRRMTVGSDFIGDRRFRLVITISNAHLCPPGAHCSFSTSDSSFPCTGWSVWGPGRRMAVGQVWALLFSLPVSIFHLLLVPLLARSLARCLSFSIRRRGIRLRVHVRVYSHFNQLRRLLSSGLSTLYGLASSRLHRHGSLSRVRGPTGLGCPSPARALLF